MPHLLQEVWIVIQNIYKLCSQELIITKALLFLKYTRTAIFLMMVLLKSLLKRAARPMKLKKKKKASRFCLVLIVTRESSWMDLRQRWLIFQMVIAQMIAGYTM